MRGDLDMKYAKARTDEEKKEIYNKWEKLINMSEKELLAWAENDDRFLASLNRAKAEEEGDIQSGYDSFHRIKRRKIKPMKDWSAQDFDNASQENGFNSRMLGGKPGEPVKDTGMSKWEISLRNWGHDPSKKSSPSYDKWKAWDKKHNKNASYAQEFEMKRKRIYEIVDLLLKNRNRNKKTILLLLEMYFEDNDMGTREWSVYFNGGRGRGEYFTPRQLAEKFMANYSELKDVINRTIASSIYQEESLYLTLSHKYFSARQASNTNRYNERTYEVVELLLKDSRVYEDKIKEILEEAFSNRTHLHQHWSRKLKGVSRHKISTKELATLVFEQYIKGVDKKKVDGAVKATMAVHLEDEGDLYLDLSHYFYGIKHQRTASNRFFIKKAFMLKNGDKNMKRSSSRILWYNVHVRDPYSGDVEVYAEELSKKEAHEDVRNIKSHGGDAWVVPVTSQDQFNKANSFLGYRNANLKGKSDMRRTASSVLRDLEIRVARLERTSRRGDSYVLTDSEVRAVEMNQRGYGFAKIILDNLDYETNTLTLDNMTQRELVEEIYGDGIGTLDNRSQLAKWMFSLEPV